MRDLPGYQRETCVPMLAFCPGFPLTPPPAAARQDYSRLARDPAIAERPDQWISCPKDGRVGPPSGKSRLRSSRGGDLSRNLC